jgi:8-oxo-dGTP pyrophosphatase MutT (NUDIX family)
VLFADEKLSPISKSANQMLEELSLKLKHRLSLPLPGKEAQLRMAHSERRENMMRYKIPDDAQKGAVLILFFEEENSIKMPLILRSEYKGVHSGQVALPGGKFEEEDGVLEATAVREAEEEVGIFKDEVEILGMLTEIYIPPSNFLVHPIVGVSKTVPVFIPLEKEVKEIIIIDIDVLLDDSILGEKEITLNSGMKINTPLFRIKNYDVWGATAMILSELKLLLREMESSQTI